jgi:hypothetical protein
MNDKNQQKMTPDFFEETLESIIYEEKEECVKRGFPALYKHTVRQYILPSGRKIDLLTFEFEEDGSNN